jgi:hypothetical protein
LTGLFALAARRFVNGNQHSQAAAEDAPESILVHG